MTYKDENLPHNTTVVFVPVKSASSSPYRKSGARRLLSLSVLTIILAGALFGWVQRPFFASGLSNNNQGQAFAAAQQQEGVLAIVGSEGASLYDEPGGFEIATFNAGEELTAVGRTADDSWISVEALNGQSGWTPRDAVVLVGLERLPVSGESAAVDTDNSATDGDEPTDNSADENAGETPETNNTDMAGAATSEPIEEVIPPTSTPAATTEAETSADNTESTADNTDSADADNAMSDESAADGAMADEGAEDDEAPADNSMAADSDADDSTTPSSDAAADEDLSSTAEDSVPTSLAVTNPSTVLGVVRNSDVQLQAEPNNADSVGEDTESLKVGDSVLIIGRTDDTEWLKVRTDDDAEGWLAQTDLVAFRLENLPVVDSADSTDTMDTSMDDAASSESASDDDMAEATDESDASEMTAADSAESEADASAGESTSASSSPSSSSTDASASSAPSSSTDTDTNADGESMDSASDSSTSDEDSQVTGSLSGIVSTAITQLNVRSGPGVNFASVGTVDANDSLTISGRSQNSGWLLADNPTSSIDQGWVSAQFVDVDGNVASLSVETSSATPISESTPSDDDTPSDASQPAASTSAQPARAEAVGGLTGKLVFQGKLGGAIYLYEFSSGQLRQLTTGFDPSLSPDGQQVAFTRLGGEGGVYLINVDGTNERRIYASAQAPRSPSWSPDGGKIVFSRLSGEYRCTNLGFGICVKNNRFLDGFPQTTKEERGLSRIDVNGENFRDIPALNTANTPDWVGSGIVYAATTSLEITQDTPEGENQAIINQVIAHQDPAWQPGGGRVVFQIGSGGHWEIYAINPDGSGIGALTRPVTALVDRLPDNVSPAWSPDGSTIVYLSNRGADNSAGPWRIWVMNADGSNQRPLPIDVPIEYQYNLEQMVDWGN